MVNYYVKAINTPGAIPNVQRAWDQFVETKCSDAIKNAVATYDALLKAQLSGELPCDSTRIRMCHDVAFQESEDQFMADIVSISSNTVEMKMRELKVRRHWAISRRCLFTSYQVVKPSGFSVLVGITAFVIYTSLGLLNESMKGKVKRILVIIVK